MNRFTTDLARLLATAVLSFALLPATVRADDDPFATRDLVPPEPAAAWSAARPATGPCRPDDALPAKVTLVDALDFALCRNPQTRQSWAAAKVAAAQVGVARSATLPNVTGSAGAQTSKTWNGTPFTDGRFDQASGSISFNYLLFDFGGRDAAMEQARENLAAADWTHNATIQSVVLSVSQAWYQFFAAAEAVVASRAAERYAQDSLDAARARQKAGTATRSDVLQARTALSQAVLTRTQNEGAASTAQGVLASAMGLSADTALELSPPRDFDGQSLGRTAVADLMKAAMARRPDIRAAQASVQAAEANVRAQESAGKPTLSLSGSVGATISNPGTDPRNGTVGVTLTVPIFTGYQNTYRIRAAREQVAQQVATRDKLRNDISLEVWRAYQDVRTQGQALASAADLVRSATESHDVALGRYKAGVGTVIDVLNAQTALIQADIQQIQARLNLNVAKIALARAIGILDVGLFAGTTPADR
ncbi:MAG: TolC family protein [Betaproteobacteria bacterium]|nr:TolC family protein [Betaproteobacteria bacterium]